MERVIQSSNNTYRFKNVVIDKDSSLVEGIDIYEDGKYIGYIIGYIDLENADGDELVKIAMNI